MVMTIREGVKFHDGTEVTPEDVRWNFQFAMGPEARDYATGGACLTASQITPKIEQTGPNQVSVSRNEPFPGWPDFVSEAFGNWIGTVHPAGLGGDPATIHDEATEAAYDKNPIGAGIFKMVKHIASESMEMERFADHYYQPDNGFDKDRRPKFTTLDMRLVPEVATPGSGPAVWGGGFRPGQPGCQKPSGGWRRPSGVRPGRGVLLRRVPWDLG